MIISSLCSGTSKRKRWKNGNEWNRPEGRFRTRFGGFDQVLYQRGYLLQQLFIIDSRTIYLTQVRWSVLCILPAGVCLVSEWHALSKQTEVRENTHFYLFSHVNYFRLLYIGPIHIHRYGKISRFFFAGSGRKFDFWVSAASVYNKVLLIVNGSLTTWN